MTTWTQPDFNTTAFVEPDFNTTAFVEGAISDSNMEEFVLLIDDTYSLLVDDTYALEIQSAVPGTAWIQPNVS